MSAVATTETVPPATGLTVAPRLQERATLHVGVVDPLPAGDGDGAAFTLRDVRAGYATNTARATATFSICHVADDAVGAVGGSLERFCTEVVPVEEGTRFRHTPGSSEQLVLTLAPRRAGRVVVDRVVVDHALGGAHMWRRGEEELPLRLAARVR